VLPNENFTILSGFNSRPFSKNREETALAHLSVKARSLFEEGSSAVYSIISILMIQKTMRTNDTANIVQTVMSPVSNLVEPPVDRAVVSDCSQPIAVCMANERVQPFERHSTDVSSSKTLALSSIV